MLGRPHPAAASSDLTASNNASNPDVVTANRIHHVIKLTNMYWHTNNSSFGSLIMAAYNFRITGTVTRNTAAARPHNARRRRRRRSWTRLEALVFVTSRARHFIASVARALNSHHSRYIYDEVIMTLEPIVVGGCHIKSSLYANIRLESGKGKWRLAYERERCNRTND